MSYPNAKKVAEVLDRLGRKKAKDATGKEMFILDLRTGQKVTTTLPGDLKGRPTTEVDLTVALPFLARYEPAQLQAQFREISELLK